MNFDHVIGLTVGVALALLVLVPLCFLIMKFAREARTARAELNSLQKQFDAEKSQTQELTELLDSVHRKLGMFRAEHDRWMKTNASLERSKARWKGHYQEIFRKHNELITSHNDLVRKYNSHLKRAKTQANQHRNQLQEASQRCQDLLSDARALQERLTETLQEKHTLFLECESFDQKISTLNADRQILADQLSEVSDIKQRLASSISGFSEQNYLLKRKLTTLVEEIEQLRIQLEDNSQSSGDLSNQVIRFCQEIAKLVRKNRDVDPQTAVFGQGITDADLVPETSQPPLLGAQREPRERTAEGEGHDQDRLAIVSQNEILLSQNQSLERETESLRQQNVELDQRIQDLDRNLQLALAGLSAGYGDSGMDSDDSTGPGNGIMRSPPQPVSPRWVDTRPVIIGLDFGTYSTKVVVRSRGEKKAKVLFVDEPMAGYPSFATPSLVRIKDGRLYFGQRAIPERGGVLLDSLKVSLLPPSLKDGWCQATMPTGTTPDLLVAFYLAWVLGRLKTILGGDTLPQVSLNVAAPMDHLENNAMKERYLHVVHAAWQSVFGTYPIRVEQGIELAQFRPLFEYWLERAIPDKSVRRFEILPETLAPLVSLSQDPRTIPGLYLMADMGAGTTEFSVSHLNELDADHRILCYADMSIVLGGNRYNENDKSHADVIQHQSQEQAMTKELLGRLNSVWYSGFQKDMNGGPALKNRWKQLKVLLSGGGLRRPKLQDSIESNVPMKKIWVTDPTEYQVSWHHPVDLEFFGPVPTDGVTSSLAYLAVAHGLSVERQKWPNWSPPSGVACTHEARGPDDPLNYGYLDW